MVHGVPETEKCTTGEGRIHTLVWILPPADEGL